MQNVVITLPDGRRLSLLQGDAACADGTTVEAALLPPMGGGPIGDIFAYQGAQDLANLLTSLLLGGDGPGRNARWGAGDCTHCGHAHEDHADSQCLGCRQDLDDYPCQDYDH